ncbi:MAG: hypothetical protein M0T79_09115 [Actinomycetota bacterium]|nr:hypothetical protein [Actinomycetota bacterium]
MSPEYVSPFDDAKRVVDPLAARPQSLDGRHVVLLDIRKNRGSELLDRLEQLMRRGGATTSRISKEIFSKPASMQVIDEAVARADLVVEALAD